MLKTEGCKFTPSTRRLLNPNFSAIFFSPAGVRFSIAVLPKMTLFEVAKAFSRSKVLRCLLPAGSFNWCLYRVVALPVKLNSVSVLI